MNLEKLLEFNKLLISFREIERTILIKGKDQLENDAEHSFQLALLGWYIADSTRLKMDKNLIIIYALAHDMVEVYAGDTSVFGGDPALHENKHEREEAALKRIKQEFPEFVDLHKAIESYEKREDKESQFVYALDKLIPVINIYQDGGRTWNKAGVTLKMILENKTPKIAISPEIDAYFHEFKKILEENKTELFVR